MRRRHWKPVRVALLPAPDVGLALTLVGPLAPVGGLEEGVATVAPEVSLDPGNQARDGGVAAKADDRPDDEPPYAPAMEFVEPIPRESLAGDPLERVLAPASETVLGDPELESPIMGALEATPPEVLEREKDVVLAEDPELDLKLHGSRDLVASRAQREDRARRGRKRPLGKGIVLHREPIVSRRGGPG